MADLSSIFSLIGKLLGKEGQVEKAREVYKANKPLFDLLGRVVKDVLSRDKPNAPPVVVAPPDPPVVVGEDGEVVPGYPRVVSGLRLSAFFEVAGEVVPKAEFQKIMSGENPLPGQGRTKVHLDIDPLDQHGVEIGPGDVNLGQLVNPDGSHKMSYSWSLGGAKGADAPVTVHQYHRDFGCTPTFKIHQTEDNVDLELVITAHYEGHSASFRVPRVKR